MDSPFPGFGTLLNVMTIVVGSLLGMSIGHRIPVPTRAVVTDCLGLVSLLVAALSAAAVLDPALGAAVGTGGPVLIVLGALIIGSVAGSVLRIEDRLQTLAGRVQSAAGRLGARGSTVASPASGGSGARVETEGRSESDERERFIEGWLSASLLFCVGPLTVLGSLSDGLGRGIDQLALKAVLDGFAALAFASTFGLGVLLSAASVAVVQGLLTLAGVLLGGVLPDAHIAALTATGGLMLVAIGLRLLQVKHIPVGDMLPALLVAPLLTQVVVCLR